MDKREIIETIDKSNITTERKKEIIAVIRKSNIPTSEKRIIIKTIQTGTKEEIILALMYILYIAKDFFDKFNPLRHGPRERHQITQKRDENQSQRARRSKQHLHNRTLQH